MYKIEEGKMVQVDEAENPTKAVGNLTKAINNFLDAMKGNAGMWTSGFGKAINDSNWEGDKKLLLKHIDREVKK